MRIHIRSSINPNVTKIIIVNFFSRLHISNSHTIETLITVVCIHMEYMYSYKEHLKTGIPGILSFNAYKLESFHLCCSLF